jgi:hypothetical protein
MYSDSRFKACRQKKLNLNLFLQGNKMQALIFPLAGSWQIIALSPLKKNRNDHLSVGKHGLVWVCLG